MKIQFFLIHKSLDIAIKEVDPDLASTTIDEMKNTDMKALIVLFLSLADNVVIVGLMLLEW